MKVLLNRRLRGACAAIAGTSFVLLSYGAAPADMPTPVSTVSADDVTQLEEYTVTGSYIPYSAEAPAIPLKRVTIDQILATGESSDLLEVIRKTLPQFIGNGNLGPANSNISGGSTNGGSQLQLRNVQTLVLINGRRATFAPVAATGGFQFVDVNSIPVSAVEAIDVVTDGSSAIYGSDAVSGVVNIILKKDFQGVEVSGSFRTAKHWKERVARAVFGATAGDTSVTVSVEHVKVNPLFEVQRDFSANQTNKTSNYPGRVDDFGFNDDPDYENDGGTFLLLDGQTPPLNTDLEGSQLVAQGLYEGPGSFNGRFNISSFATLSLGNDKTGVTTMLTHDVSDNLQLFGDLLYSRTDTFYQLAAQPIVGMPFTSDHVTDFGIGVGVTNPEHPQNPFNTYVLVRNRFVGHEREYEMYTTTLRALGGFRAKLNDTWSLEGAINLNTASQDYINRNVLNRVALSNAIDAGLVNLFAKVQDPTLLAQANIFGIATSKNDSSLYTADIHVNGTVATLPGGPVQVAFGYEGRNETLAAEPDAGSYTILDPASPQYGQPFSWDGATTSDPFDKHRSVDAVFGQVRVPITGPEQHIAGLYTLELDVAERYERYSDTDDPAVPKILLRYLPVSDEFAIRASYNKAFNAPTLYSLFGPSGVGYTDELTNFERFDGGVIGDEADQALLRLTTNPNLKPERATSYNVGFVYSPRKLQGLTVEASYFRIKQTDIIGRESDFDVLQDVELNGTSSIYCDRVRFGGFNGTPVTHAGQISESFDQFNGTFSAVYLTNFSENFVTAEQDGADVRVQYVKNIEPLGTTNVTLNGIWYNSFTVEEDEFVGTTNGNSILNGGTIPRWRANLLVSVQRGDLSYGFNIDHIPAVIDTGADPDETDPTFDQHVESFTRTDVFASYRFRGDGSILDGLTVRLGVNNVFDKQPPMANSSWSDSGSDTGIYDWLGRVYYADVSYHF